LALHTLSFEVLVAMVNSSQPTAALHSHLLMPTLESKDIAIR